MNLKSNITKFYFYRLLNCFVFHTPIFILYWKNYLSLTQIMVVTIAFTGLGILLEVPSGIFADLYGRKKALILGTSSYFLAAIGFILAPMLGSIAGNFFMWFLIAECFAGIAYTFNSGADTAFLYDSLKKEKREHEFKKIRGETFAIGLASTAIGAFFGGLIANFGLEKPYYFTAIFVFISILAALTFKEPNKYKSSEKKNYWQHQVKCLKFVITHKRVRWLCLYYGLLFSSCLMGLVFFQLYLKQIGTPLNYFGIIYMIIIFFGALVSAKAHNIERALGENKSLILLPLILGSAFVLMSFVKNFWGLVPLFAIQAVFSFIVPVLDQYMHEHVASSERATVLSIRNLIASILFTILSPILGVIGDKVSLTTALFTIGGIVLIFGSVILSSRPSDNKNRTNLRPLGQNN